LWQNNEMAQLVTSNFFGKHDYTRFVNLEHRPYDEFEQFSDF